MWGLCFLRECQVRGTDKEVFEHSQQVDQSEVASYHWELGDAGSHVWSLWQSQWSDDWPERSTSLDWRLLAVWFLQNNCRLHGFKVQELPILICDGAPQEEAEAYAEGLLLSTSSHGFERWPHCSDALEIREHLQRKAHTTAHAFYLPTSRPQHANSDWSTGQSQRARYFRCRHWRAP